MEGKSPVDLTGLLLREGGGFLLVADAGGRFLLQLRRVPVDEVGKRVRVIGIQVSDTLIEVDGIRRA